MKEIIQLGNIYPTKTRMNPNQGRVYDSEGISPSLNCMTGGCRQPYIIERNGGCVRVRRFTPRECLRLMGFDDADVAALIEAGFSNTQLYKFAGNSIVVDVVECLFSQIFDSNYDIWL